MASGILGLFTSPIISTLADAIAIGITLLENTSIIFRVFKVLFSIFMPTLVDGAVVLYNAIYFNKGVELKLCWFPTWWDKWGISVTSI